MGVVDDPQPRTWLQRLVDRSTPEFFEPGVRADLIRHPVAAVFILVWLGWGGRRKATERYQRVVQWRRRRAADRGSAV